MLFSDCSDSSSFPHRVAPCRCFRCLVEKGDNWGDSPLHVAARLDVLDGSLQFCKRSDDEYEVDLVLEWTEDRNMVSP